MILSTVFAMSCNQTRPKTPTMQLEYEANQSCKLVKNGKLTVYTTGRLKFNRATLQIVELISNVPHLSTSEKVYTSPFLF